MKKYSVIIPAYNPPEELIDMVEQLTWAEIPAIIVINDGSSKEYQAIFNQVNTFDNTHIITHEVNHGKGTGLKNGFAYHYKNFTDLKGVVTADADGQHRVEDIVKVGNLLVEREAEYVLGMRDFKSDNVPMRSIIGNRLSSMVFKRLYGVSFYDTQTGLRAVKTEEIPELKKLSGDGFEFELSMLIHMAKQKKFVVKVDINTIYANEHSSHFNTIIDTIKVGKIMLMSKKDKIK